MASNVITKVKDSRYSFGTSVRITTLNQPYTFPDDGYLAVTGPYTGDGYIRCSINNEYMITLGKSASTDAFSQQVMLPVKKNMTVTLVRAPASSEGGGLVFVPLV